MFGKIGAFFNLLRVGQEVSDPQLWTRRQDFGNKIGALILAIVAVLRFYDIDLPIDAEAALLIGGGIATLWNIVLTYIAHKHLGALPAKPEAPAEYKPPQYGDNGQF